jgi:hypothetical protein
MSVSVEAVVTRIHEDGRQAGEVGGGIKGGSEARGRPIPVLREGTWAPVIQQPPLVHRGEESLSLLPCLQCRIVLCLNSF